MRLNVEASPLVEHFCSQQLRMPSCSACGKRHRDHFAMMECRQRRKRVKHSAVTLPLPPTPPPLIELQAEVTPSPPRNSVCFLLFTVLQVNVNVIPSDVAPPLPPPPPPPLLSLPASPPLAMYGSDRDPKVFQTILKKQEMVYCKNCSEAWFGLKPADAVSCGNFFVTQKCGCCRKKHSKTVLVGELFSAQNKMHPQRPPAFLSRLSDTEEALIALHAPVLRVFRLRGGQLGYSGSCAALTQDVGQVARVLPRALNALDMVIFVKTVDGSAENDESVRKQFRVRRRVVHNWLVFLKANNPFYSHIEIDCSALELLPEDSNGGLDHLSPLESDVEPNGVTSGEISVCVIDGLNENCGNEIEAKRDTILQWPQQSKEAIKEFKNPGIFAKCFPSIFPFGTGDPTSSTRSIAVSMSQGIHHLTKYAFIEDERLVWPFAEHKLAPFYAHDVHMRQALLGQSAVFLKQRDCDFPTSKDELLSALMNPEESGRVLKLIGRFAGNCLGTNGYWSRRKEELVSLCAQSPPHLWWTLSAADLHWPDLKRFVNDPTNAPHITDAWFSLRVEEYIKWFYGPDVEWMWWRTEYQSRGSAHAHGCVRLKHQRDVDELYQRAVRGRLEGATVCDQEAGRRAEEEICSMADYFSSASAILLAQDALSNQRESVIENSEPRQPHPASYICEDELCETLRYADLLNIAQRHSHRKSYCGCDPVTGEGKCRFGAPWNLESKTRFAWTATKNGPVGTLVYRRNDRWMNLYNPSGARAHV